MPNTSTFGWPYPAGTAAADVPYDMQQLAQAIENTLAGVWTAFTPTIVGTSAPTVEARYRQIGKTVSYRIEIVMTAAVTAAMTFTLPVAQRAAVAGSNPSYGSIFAKDNAGIYINGQAIWSGTGTVCRIMLAASGTNSNLADASATTPMTWNAGDSISIRGEYEAA